LKEEKLQGSKKKWSRKGWDIKRDKTQKLKGKERKDQDIILRKRKERKGE
jgi:hypothetical protein